jgi:hypothetical protein
MVKWIRVPEMGPIITFFKEYFRFDFLEALYLTDPWINTPVFAEKFGFSERVQLQTEKP